MALLAFVIAGPMGSPVSAVELKVAAHIHSEFSHGSSESIEKIAGYAEQRGLDALLLTDTAVAHWSYGLAFSNFLSYVQAQPSILERGPSRYLSEIERAQRAHPSVILVPGAEAAAYYRWSGRPWSRLILHDWHRHMTLIGLHNADDYSNLPALGNRHSYRFSWFSLWPIWFFVLGFCGRKAGIPILPMLLYGAGFIFLANAFPFRRFPWSPYDGTTSWEPYRNLARYGEQHGALVFWAHPESPNWSKPFEISSRLSVQTEPYPEAIREAPEADGFGVFMEGNRGMSDPGGEWDQALQDYCDGKRSKIPWGIAELDYKGWGVMGTYIDTVYMVVQAEAKTEPSILAALRSGRFYSVEPAKAGALSLDEWKVSAAGDVSLALSRRDASHVSARVLIIRDGKAIVDEHRALPASWNFRDTAPAEPCASYRVMVRDDENGYLASNPLIRRLMQ